MTDEDTAGTMEEVRDWKMGDLKIQIEDPSQHSMPAVEEAITQSGGRSSPSKGINKKWWVFLAAALVVVLVVVIPVAVVENTSTSSTSSDNPIDKVDDNPSDKDSDADLDHGSGQGQTPADDVQSDRNAGFSAVVEYLVAQDVSHRSDLETEGSPQHEAAMWIANDDKANHAVPMTGRDDLSEGYKYIVRYVMAVNWFAMKGHDWYDDLFFMTARDVCGWHRLDILKGVFFYGSGPLTGVPFALHLCKLASLRLFTKRSVRPRKVSLSHPLSCFSLHTRS